MSGAAARWTRLALAAALAVVAAVALGWGWRAQPPADAGDVRAAVAASVSAAPAAAPAPATPEGAAGDPGRLPTATARPAVAPPAQEPVAPVALSVDRLGEDIPVTSVGATPDGAMEIPRDGGVVGWYRFGSAPGAAQGSAVLAGHVDTREGGRGALFGLRELQVGDGLEVTLADGRVLRYAVTARSTIDKAELPVEDLFAEGGAPRLVVITCGGPWRPDVRSYRDNVVVLAEPVA